MFREHTPACVRRTRAAAPAVPSHGPTAGIPRSPERRSRAGAERSILAENRGETERAESLLEAALAWDPAGTEAMARLFRMRRSEGREAGLEPAIREALRINSGSVLHQNWLGLILERHAGIDRPGSSARSCRLPGAYSDPWCRGSIGVAAAMGRSPASGSRRKRP